MNNKKAKAIRRAMRRELEHGSGYKVVYHPFLFVNRFNERCVRYRAQYISNGGDQMVKLGKKIYNKSGILPREATV
jgi:hypothetical protein